MKRGGRWEGGGEGQDVNGHGRKVAELKILLTHCRQKFDNRNNCSGGILNSSATHWTAIRRGGGEGGEGGDRRAIEGRRKFLMFDYRASDK